MECFRIGDQGRIFGKDPSYLGSEVPEHRGESVCYKTAEDTVDTPLGEWVNILEIKIV